MDKGLMYAVMAVRAFQARHDQVPMYRHAKTKRGKAARRKAYTEEVRRARRFVKKARAAGFRGSVMERLGIKDLTTKSTKDTKEKE